jgi:hypothetical protein
MCYHSLLIMICYQRIGYVNLAGIYNATYLNTFRSLAVLVLVIIYTPHSISYSLYCISTQQYYPVADATSVRKTYNECLHSIRLVTHKENTS